MGDKVSVIVECYSGSAYGERPTAVVLQGVRQEISQIIDAKQTPSGRFFSVILKSGEQIDLIYDQAFDVWTTSG